MGDRGPGMWFDLWMEDVEVRPGGVAD
jgi:hypothetical protein